MLGVLSVTLRRRRYGSMRPTTSRCWKNSAGARVWRFTKRGCTSASIARPNRFKKRRFPLRSPRCRVCGLDAFYAPGHADAQVGGDWYDALRLLDGRVVVSIGDVAGSGLHAAVTMGNMRQIIRGIAQVHADPALMLDAADRALRLEHPDKFVTAFVGVFDPIMNTLTYASAGQPPPLLRLPEGTIEPLSGSGLPLGLRSNVQRTHSTKIDLPAGSTLLLYTDGLTEFDRAPELGERRLRALFGSMCGDGKELSARSIVDEMMNGSASRDDVAVLVLNVAAPVGRDHRGREVLQRWSFHTDDVRSATASRRAFAEGFRDRGVSDEDVALGEIVFGELVGNTVRYAPGAVDVIVDWSGPDPVLHVLDTGPGFRHISILPPDLLSESGRGLFYRARIDARFPRFERPERRQSCARGAAHSQPPTRRRPGGRLLERADPRVRRPDRHHRGLKTVVPRSQGLSCRALGKQRIMSILEVIKREHRDATAMLDRAQKLEPDDVRLAELAKRIQRALSTHVEIEERLFYGQLRKRAREQEQRVDVFEAYTEHEVAAHLIALLKSRRKRDERFKAELQVLGESIKHHVREEESTIFGLARTLLTPAELDDLGMKWEKARQRLPADPAKPAAARKKAA